jgi:hypothetical protein
MNESVLPTRSSGSHPSAIPTNPHTQLEQHPHSEMEEELARRVFALSGVEEHPSAIYVPGARLIIPNTGRCSGSPIPDGGYWKGSGNEEQNKRGLRQPYRVHSVCAPSAGERAP